MIFRLPTLYKRDTNGNIRELTVEYSNGVMNATRTIAGIKDGNLVTSGWKDAVGKNTGKANATTDAEQAQKEAKAMWDKKAEKEYFEDINLVDTYDKFKPQLAHDYSNLNEGQKMALDINIQKPYKLCDFKPAYGKIFEDYLEAYDFWVHCDLDIRWGDIRKFIPEKVLEEKEPKDLDEEFNIPIKTIKQNKLKEAIIEHYKVLNIMSNFTRI